MSYTFRVVHPATGELVEYTAYRRGSRVVYQQLAPQVHLENSSAARLRAIADFSRVGIATYGQTGFRKGLPVTAANVRDRLTRPGPKRRIARELRQDEIRARIPEETQQVIEKVLGLGRISVAEPISPFFSPIRRRTLAEVGEGVRPLRV